MLQASGRRNSTKTIGFQTLPFFCYERYSLGLDRRHFSDSFRLKLSCPRPADTAVTY